MKLEENVIVNDETEGSLEMQGNVFSENFTETNNK